jgi:CHRD domain-containing protein
MRLRLKLAAGVAVLGLAGIGTAAIAHDNSRFDANLTGYEEVPTLSTSGTGTFKAWINRGKDEIRYVLTYAGPFDANPAGGTVTQAHIHFGARSLAPAGNIIAFLCTNLNNGPAGTPACPAAPGTVTGTLTPASVIGPAAQGIAPGEFAEMVRALRAGAAYANVHTTTFPAGEIRGQISSDDDGHHGRDH